MKTGRPILIVDDEPNVRLVFSTALESDGIKLSIAEDGETALRLFKQSRFDLVLLDLKMPELSGLEFLHSFERRETTFPWSSSPRMGASPTPSWR